MVIRYKAGYQLELFIDSNLGYIDVSDRFGRFLANISIPWVVWNLELGDFANRFSLVNKIERWKKLYMYVELFAARILN